MTTEAAMPDDEFRSKFKAKAEADKARQDNVSETDKKYKATALREYPRLVNELAARVSKLFEAVPEVTVTPHRRSEILVHSKEATFRGVVNGFIGPAQITDLHIKFAGKELWLRGAGVNQNGCHGKIEVTAGAYKDTPPFRDGIIMVSPRVHPDEPWTLAYSQRGTKEWPELTDAVLKQHLETFFLS